MTHFIYIPFRGVGVDLQDKQWFAERVSIFEQYTLKSLVAQTNKDFTVWLSFRPKDRFSSQIARIERLLEQNGLRYVLTFNGLMYHDDKFGKGRYLKNALRVIRWCYRTGEWKKLLPMLEEMLHDKNADLKERLTSSLHELPEYDGDVLLTRIDSDDMFHKDAVGKIQRAIGVEAITIPKGYIHNTETGEVAEWNPKTNPPFHTIRFLLNTFWKANTHIARYHGYKSHEDIDDRFLRMPLEERLFCVTTRNPKMHISTTWNHHYRGKLVDPSVLKEFGL